MLLLNILAICLALVALVITKSAETRMWIAIVVLWQLSNTIMLLS